MRGRCYHHSEAEIFQPLLNDCECYPTHNQPRALPLIDKAETVAPVAGRAAVQHDLHTD